MKMIVLLAVLTLAVSSAHSQNFPPKLIVFQPDKVTLIDTGGLAVFQFWQLSEAFKDTAILISKVHFRNLNLQISRMTRQILDYETENFALRNAKLASDSINFNNNTIIKNKDLEIANNQMEIFNLNEEILKWKAIMKEKTWVWIRRILYIVPSSVAAGVITGIIIIK